MVATASPRLDHTPGPPPVALPYPATAEQLPEGLREYADDARFVPWRWAYRDGKWTKPPVNPHTGGAASVTDPETWGTLTQAAACAKRLGLPGLGIVLTADMKIVGGDEDHCRNPVTSELSPEASWHVQLMNTISMASATGTGIRWFARGELPAGYDGRRRGPFEVYRSRRYLTLTTEWLPGTPARVEERQEQIDAWLSDVFPSDEPKDAPVPPAGPVPVEDETLLERMFTASNGPTIRRLWDGDLGAHGGDDSGADQALCNHLAWWTDRDEARIDRLFRRSGLYREKWERADYRAKTIGKAIAKVTQGYRPPKAVTLNGTARRNGTQNGRPHLGDAPGGANTVTKGVIHPGDSLSTDERLSNAALWEALGCRLGSTVQLEQIDWLWQNRFALSKFNLLEGDGGEGKSLLLCDLTARLTGNLPLPDGSPNPFGEKVPVVLMMAEDGDADTILPRILAAGGDPKCVILLKHVPDEDGGHFPTIPDDVAHIWHVCKTAGAKALIIDPGNAYLSAEVNSNNDHSVRRALAQFPDMAADVGMAILWVRHLNKNTAADPKNRGGGSAAFLNLARTALAVGPSPDDDTGARRVLAVNKINLDVQDAAWAYHPETAYVPKDAHSGEMVKTARIVWEGPSTFTAADILTARPDPEERSAGEVCKQMLQELLAEGPQAEREVWQAINQARISESSYRRTRRTLNVHTWREGGVAGDGHWMLSLTPRPDAKAVTAPGVERDSLSKSTPVPDRETAPARAKAVTGMNDRDSERLRPAPTKPPARPADAISVQKDADHGGGYCTDKSHAVWERQLRPGEKAWQWACVECWPQPEGGR